MEIEEFKEEYYRQKNSKLWSSIQMFLAKEYRLRNISYLKRAIYSNEIIKQHLAVIGLIKILNFAKKQKKIQKNFIFKIFFQANMTPRLIEFLVLKMFPLLQYESLKILLILLKERSKKQINKIIKYGAIYSFLICLTSKYEKIAQLVNFIILKITKLLFQIFSRFFVYWIFPILQKTNSVI